MKKIVDCNEYLFAIADASDGANVYVYLMTKSGKKVKRVLTTYNVGGGW